MNTPKAQSLIDKGDYILDPNETLEFNGQVLCKATNKKLTSKNKKIIPENTLHFYCHKDAKIGNGVYICDNAKICSEVILTGENYIGTNVILLNNVIIPVMATVTSSNLNVNNKTAEEVKEFYKN